MGIKVIITGATGMVGEGVTRQCIAEPSVEKILVVGRRSSGIQHSKVSELIIPDVSDPAANSESLAGYDACFFCLGVSSVGMNEADYTKLTYDLTIGFAEVLRKKNPDLTFCYISGAATDSSEKGRSMWARVKGRTENKLLEMFKNAYMFRPGYMQPDRGAKNTLKYYRYIGWMYPTLRFLFPKFVTTLAELGKAMIACALLGNDKKKIEVPDIVRLAKAGSGREAGDV